MYVTNAVAKREKKEQTTYFCCYITSKWIMAIDKNNILRVKPNIVNQKLSNLRD